MDIHGYPWISMDISILKFAFVASGAGHVKAFVACLGSRNAATCCIWPLEPGPEPQMARNGCPGAADGSKWPLEPAPEPQNTRKVPLEFALEPRSARRVPFEPAPEPQNARRVPLEPAPEPQDAPRVPLEPALEPQHARKVPLELTAVRCVRFLRSKWPLEKCCLLFLYYRHHFLLGSTFACYARVRTSIY